MSRDLESMLDTALTIQKRTAERIGVTEGALRTYQACVRYGHGEYFLRAGRWRRGASLTVRNLAGAPHSATAILERLARIIISPKLIASLRSLGWLTIS